MNSDLHLFIQAKEKAMNSDLHLYIQASFVVQRNFDGSVALYPADKAVKVDIESQVGMAYAIVQEHEVMDFLRAYPEALLGYVANREAVIEMNTGLFCAMCGVDF